MKVLNILLGMFFLFTLTFYAQTGVRTKSPQAVFHVDAKKNNSNNPTNTEKSDDFFILNSGQVALGTNQPNPSALFEINTNNSSKKYGFLPPRVSLTSNVDVVTIPAPTIGLLVYNLGEKSTFSFIGFVFWDGIQWRKLNGDTIIEGKISSLQCAKIRLVPDSYAQGVPYEGILEVPYFNGNGGGYPEQILPMSNGLIAKRSAGNLEVGPGIVYYQVTGTPVLGSPNLTTFDVELAGSNCITSVGGGDGLDQGAFASAVYKIPANIGATTPSIGDLPARVSGLESYPQGNHHNMWVSTNITNHGYTNPGMLTVGGKLRIDGYFTRPADNNRAFSSFVPRLVNVSNEPVRFWFAAVSTVDKYNYSNLVLASEGPSNLLAPNGGGWVNLDNELWSNIGPIASQPMGQIVNSDSRVQEVLTLDIDLDNGWYRVYYFLSTDDNNTPTNFSDDFRRLHVSVQKLY